VLVWKAFMAQNKGKQGDSGASEGVQKSPAALREEQVLAFWDEHRIFEKTLQKDAPKGEFVFYEGPPTANAPPAIHHLEARTFKDVIPRFRTMQGYHVARRAGWDTHGLPVELQVEKALGMNSKRDIEAYGIAAFNKKCKESVFEYIGHWERFTKRIGFWVEQDKAYYTFDPTYMESLWHIISRVSDRGLLYKDYKVVPWCPRCGTALSSHELAQGYVDTTDLSVYVKFALVDEPGTYILAWTTTPWTLPGNVGLAVGEKISYQKIKVGDEQFILAAELVERLIDSEYEVVANLKGADLLGKAYEPLYPYLRDVIPESQRKNLENAWKVYAADFVTTEDGTGIVHTAVMYGADDFDLGTKVGLPKHHLVSEDGHFIPEVKEFAGLFVRDENTAVEIIKNLAHRNLLLKKEKYTHSYPHCWRCKTALIYYARDSWYIRMSELRDELVKENEKINWEPSHIKDGRFGEWLREVKDWAISRERYWGTPLPVWRSDDGTEQVVIGSIEELKKRSKKSGNRYFLMRHGESENNVKNTVNCDASRSYGLTERGKSQTDEAIKSLTPTGITSIFTSPFPRARETAERVASALGLLPDAIVVDERLSENGFGILDGKSVEEYHGFFSSPIARMTEAPEGGETWHDAKQRITDLLYEVEASHANESVLFVGHNGPFEMLQAGAAGMGDTEAGEAIADNRFQLQNAEIRELAFVPLPHNEAFELDLHRPFIDEIVLVSDTGKELRRTPEVMDVWFDSGGMPFAQDHYPFENKEHIEGAGYPADYISEAIDQTRGWFYTLHAIGILMERGRAYKNVISLGHLLDAEGKKMSKSLGNIVNPWEEADRYGVDTLRFWMCSVNAPGEPKYYDPRTVAEVQRKVFTLFENVTAFYELYASDVPHGGVDPRKSPHVLDRWILSRMDAFVERATNDLEAFRVLEPAREIRDFIADLSQWYVRRSRERVKFAPEEERAYALATLRYVIEVLARTLAPFSPFASEDVFRRVGGSAESVHLAEWPSSKTPDIEILDLMHRVRDTVSKALDARTKAGIKIRQPLATIRIKDSTLANKDEYLDLIRDEVNVKEVAFDSALPSDVALDTELTTELAEEGAVRELIRAVQDLRKKAGLAPSDRTSLSLSTGAAERAVVEKYRDEISRVAGIDSIQFSETQGEVVRAGDYAFTISLT
jgi:isoleucyl-tRNA synthetase